MTNLASRIPRLPVVAFACALLTVSWSIAKADPPTTDALTSAAEESLDVRHARAHFELAQLDLRRAEELNKRIPHFFSDRTMDFLRKHVEIDREQLEQTLLQQSAGMHEVYVRGAKAAVELADAEVQRKKTIYQQAPDHYNRVDLDRSLAVAKVAKLNLERTVAQKDAVHTSSYLQWQIEELRNQFLELQIKYEKTARR